MGLKKKLLNSVLYFILICKGMVAAPVSWKGPRTVYIGIPGVTTERYAFLSKYSTYFKAQSTNEILRSKSLNIVKPDATYVVRFPEIIPFESCWWWERCWNSFWRQKIWARQVGIEFHTRPLFSIAPFGCSVTAYGVDRSRVNMGGDGDIQSIHSCLTDTQEWIACVFSKIPPRSVWLAYSRGVMGALRYFKQCRPEHVPHALVLEGGIDDVPHFLNHLFETHLPHWLRTKQRPAWLINILRSGFKFFYAPQYQEVGSNLQATLESIPDNLPVLLVTSRGDELVSYRCMVRIYKTLRDIRVQRGGTGENVHLLVLDAARHSYYVNSVTNLVDCSRYERCVHAFYERYGLAYDGDLACAGAAILQEATNVNVAALLQGSPCNVCQACIL